MADRHRHLTGAEVVNVASGCCLDTSGGDSGAGTKIVTDNCQPWWDESLGQTWHLQ